MGGSSHLCEPLLPKTVVSVYPHKRHIILLTTTTKAKHKFSLAQASMKRWYPCPAPLIKVGSMTTGPKECGESDPCWRTDPGLINWQSLYPVSGILFFRTRHHAVRKPKQLRGRSCGKRNPHPWPTAPAKLPANIQDRLASRVGKSS